MKKIKIGKTDIEVSVISLGAMYFGSKINSETSNKILDKFSSAGGNFIDTANIYAHWIEGYKGGESESFLGDWMIERKNRRDLIIATKTGIEYPGSERGLRKYQIIQECEKSLSRLKTDYIDIYFSHYDDTETPVDETLEAFEELKRDGKIRATGASNFSKEQFAKSISLSKEKKIIGYSCLQQRYSYLMPSKEFSFNNQVILDSETKIFCGKNNISVLAYSPLLGGLYSGVKYELSKFYETKLNDKKLKMLERIEVETGFTKNQIVLCWLLNSNPPVIPVLGVSSKAQLEENLTAEKLKLDFEHFKILNSL
ncbi:MAG TPA: aldo/keto reductase [Ignavibacteriaceae bacterium]|nr:aldo/keto reductase [Ignavibacteriaceae bacterium]